MSDCLIIDLKYLLEIRNILKWWFRRIFVIVIILKIEIF